MGRREERVAWSRRGDRLTQREEKRSKRGKKRVVKSH